MFNDYYSPFFKGKNRKNIKKINIFSVKYCLNLMNCYFASLLGFVSTNDELTVSH